MTRNKVSKTNYANVLSVVTSAAHIATMFHAKFAIKKQIIDFSHFIDLLNEFTFYILLNILKFFFKNSTKLRKFWKFHSGN